jgi:biotin carboxyl carrier protein
MSAGGAVPGGAAGPGRAALRASVVDPQDADGGSSVVVEPSGDEPAPAPLLVDGEPTLVVLRPIDDRRSLLEVGDSPGVRHRLLVGPARRRARDGIVGREIVVDGWRVEVDVEAAWRSELRERAGRSAVGGPAGGPLEVRASIPGRIVAVSVSVGDEVHPDGALMVLEAMKMQNEIRAVRHGFVERVAVGVGENVEVGDLLLVIR